MSSPTDPGNRPQPAGQEPLPFSVRLKRLVLGAPRDLADKQIFHRLSLIAFLAWVGLGADGLSSSSYGPEEAFRTLGQHTYLAVGLAAVTALTVSIIAIAYSRVIEHFPHGGGGYVVASKLLGSRAGLVSGCALLVDYVLTITISIAAAGDALFSFLPIAWLEWKLPVEMALIAFLIILNLRGVKESVITLTPIFLVFVLTHVILITGGIIAHAPRLPATVHAVSTGFSGGLATLGVGGMFLLFIHAYSLGGGTYTGIEAVSNGLAIMREPHVQTGKRTMLYMAASLAFTASGLLFCYLLWNVTSEAGKTMNAVLVEKFVEVVPLGNWFVIVTLFSEGALLVVAAQAGFVDGPRVLANMAIDSWAPRHFAALSDRLTTRNGILLMGLASLLPLLYTKGDVRQIVVMYSINVFITFSMTQASMCHFHYG
ncbi:MAG: APC family permease, partial [bacterium]